MVPPASRPGMTFTGRRASSNPEAGIQCSFVLHNRHISLDEKAQSPQ
jgi:hypothetical protein